MSIEERKQHYASIRRLESANYRFTNDPTKRCNICDSGKQVLGTGIRLCRINVAFVTCGGTCDSFNKECPEQEKANRAAYVEWKAGEYRDNTKKEWPW